MKAVALADIEQFQLLDMSDPVLNDQFNVLLRVRNVGICGSDIHYFEEGRIGDQIIDFPFTLGHEFSAIVEEVGDEVTTVQRGDLVAGEPAVSCHQCDQCLANRPHTCRELRFIGAPGQLRGAMSEYIAVPETNCYPVPEHMTAEAACLAEPLSIGCYAVELAPDITESTVGILGAGPIGLGVYFAAREEGITAAYCTDKLDYRCGIAKDVGIDWSGNPDTEDVVGEIREVEPAGLDVVFECCGDQEALDQGIDLLKPGGTLLIVGIPSEDHISFDIDTIRRKEITIKNVRRQNHQMQPAIDLVANNPDVTETLYTHQFPPEQAQLAFGTVADYRDNVVKAMVEMGE